MHSVEAEPQVTLSHGQRVCAPTPTASRTVDFGRAEAVLCCARINTPSLEAVGRRVASVVGASVVIRPVQNLSGLSTSMIHSFCRRSYAAHYSDATHLHEQGLRCCSHCPHGSSSLCPLSVLVPTPGSCNGKRHRWTSQPAAPAPEGRHDHDDDGKRRDSRGGRKQWHLT